ncbi:MAG: DNA-binding protein WhiA [Clostridia bacterium]|nr:DNA-binding protein WhiA [Clostridia bacterium]
MSFTTEIDGELLQATISKTCCRKALLLGLLIQARRMGFSDVTTSFRSKEIAVLATELLKRQFSADADIEEQRGRGRTAWLLTVHSKAVDRFLEWMDGDGEEKLFSAAGFRCADCSGAFLRGVFLASAAVTDPAKGYHAELLFRSERRASRVEALLGDALSVPGRIHRKNGVGLYYKSNGGIADLLYFVGALDASFRMANVCIERDIRNQENRATNCVTHNISRAVEASRKHVEAIAYLKKIYRFDALSEELRYTADLRREHPSASLAELAAMHDPAITKSGLNRRLQCILSEAREEGWSEESE